VFLPPFVSLYAPNDEIPFQHCVLFIILLVNHHQQTIKYLHLLEAYTMYHTLYTHLTINWSTNYKLKMYMDKNVITFNKGCHIVRR